MTAPTHRVLLVDDEPALLGALRRVVERACPSAVVVYASDPTMAIWQLQTTEICFVVTDLRMNGDDHAGIAVVNAARAAGVPVATLTGTNDESLLAHLAKAHVPTMLKRTLSSERLVALLADSFGSP